MFLSVNALSEHCEILMNKDHKKGLRSLFEFFIQTCVWIFFCYYEFVCIAFLI